MRILFVLLVSFTFLLGGCASNVTTPNGASQWDFDHQLQYKKTELADGSYHIKVIAKYDTEFSKLAMFIMRKSLRLCGSYGFKIEVLEGVERFDQKLSFPNMLMPSLAANIECPHS